MSIPDHLSTLDVSRVGAHSVDMDQAMTTVLNLAYPSRPNVYAPWACPPKPLVIKPTVCTRYEAIFVFSNGSSGLVGHHVQSSASLGYFELDTLKWMKRILSRYVCRFRRKVALAKAKLSVALRRRNQPI